jgi:hypothetical protein
MPAQKINYLVVYPHDAQVYGCSSKDIALQSPPPEGFGIKDKRVYFISMEPENGNLVWYRLPQEDVESAELVYPKATLKKKKEVNVDS